LSDEQVKPVQYLSADTGPRVTKIRGALLPGMTVCLFNEPRRRLRKIKPPILSRWSREADDFGFRHAGFYCDKAIADRVSSWGRFGYQRRAVRAKVEWRTAQAWQP
jgi:hypothetical protein